LSSLNELAEFYCKQNCNVLKVIIHVSGEFNNYQASAYK